MRSRVGGAIILVAMTLAGSRASAQTPDEIKAARELFQEAFKDEQEKRFPEALDKFQRVAKVKESASVRYRIATVLAGMGRLREARDGYRALAASKSSLSPADQETADSAAEKAAELDRRIPRLVLRLEDHPPPDVRVSVDGTPVSASSTTRPIELDPGPHVIASTARGSTPSEETVELADGAGEVTHTLHFTPEKKDTKVEPPPPSRSNAVPWVVVGVGAALVGAGAVLLVLREGDISDIERDCPNNRCPTSSRGAVEDNRSQAELFGPLGVGLGAAGLVAAGIGVYLLVTSPSAPAKAPDAAWRISPRGAGVSLAF